RFLSWECARRTFHAPSRKQLALRPMKPSERQAARLEPIHEQIQTQPDDVHKVPVPGHAFKTEMIGGGEMTLVDPQPDDKQHQGSHAYVETVEARQQIKGRPINAGAKLQVQIRISVHVLIALAADERDPQQDSDTEPQRAL